MGRPSNTGERRAQIVQALARVMGRTSYAGATIALIAKEAGLRAGLVHYHFESKREILLALVDALRDTVTQRYEARRADRHPLEAFIEAHLELGRDADAQAVAAWAAIGAEAAHDAELRRIYRGALAGMSRELRRLLRAELRAQGRVTRGADAIAAALLCAIEGALRVGPLAPQLIPRGSAAGMVKAMARGLVHDQERA